MLVSFTDPASHFHPEEVHIWKTHPGQAGEVLHEERRWPGSSLRPSQWHHVNQFPLPYHVYEPHPPCLTLQKAFRPLSPSKSYSPWTSSTPSTPVSMTTLREEPVATGGLSFCQILLPLPHPSPGLLNWGREGREWREVRPVPLIAPLPSFFCFSFPFISFFFFPDELKKSFHFLLLLHTILVSPPSSYPSYLPLWDGTSI